MVSSEANFFTCPLFANPARDWQKSNRSNMWIFKPPADYLRSRHRFRARPVFLIYRPFANPARDRKKTHLFNMCFFKLSAYCLWSRYLSRTTPGFSYAGPLLIRSGSEKRATGPTCEFPSHRQITLGADIGFERNLFFGLSALCQPGPG